jgi:hypothetical protein
VQPPDRPYGSYVGPCNRMATGLEPSAAVRLYRDVRALVSFLSWNDQDKPLFSEARAGITVCTGRRTRASGGKSDVFSGVRGKDGLDRAWALTSFVTNATFTR